MFYKLLILSQADGKFFIPNVAIQKPATLTETSTYGIPIYWTVHETPSINTITDSDFLMKYIRNLRNGLGKKILNFQVFFFEIYDFHYTVY